MLSGVEKRKMEAERIYRTFPRIRYGTLYRVSCTGREIRKIDRDIAALGIVIVAGSGIFIQLILYFSSEGHWFWFVAGVLKVAWRLSRFVFSVAPG